MSALADCLESGIGLTVAMQAFTLTEHLAPGTQLGPVGEIRLVPDPRTFAVLPYAPREARLLCDMYTLDGLPWELCPRTFLHEMIDRAGRHGLRVEAAFEYEFYLARQIDDGRFVPADDSLCFSSDGMDRQGTVIGAIIDALEQQGLQPRQYYPELGPPNRSSRFSTRPCCEAADRQIAVRETVRAIALQHGLVAIVCAQAVRGPGRQRLPRAPEPVERRSERHVRRPAGSSACRRWPLVRGRRAAAPARHCWRDMSERELVSAPGAEHAGARPTRAGGRTIAKRRCACRRRSRAACRRARTSRSRPVDGVGQPVPGAGRDRRGGTGRHRARPRPGRAARPPIRTTWTRPSARRAAFDATRHAHRADGRAGAATRCCSRRWAPRARTSSSACAAPSGRTWAGVDSPADRRALPPLLSDAHLGVLSTYQGSTPSRACRSRGSAPAAAANWRSTRTSAPTAARRGLAAPRRRPPAASCPETHSASTLRREPGCRPATHG